VKLLRGHWQLLLILAVIFALWATPVIIPLKILIVFMHEVSHGLAAILTGGEIESLSISIKQGGQAVTRGGNGFIITSAGYPGSLLIGIFIFLLALKSRFDRLLMAEQFGGTTMFWGGVWLVLSLITIAACLRYGIGERSNIDFSRKVAKPDDFV